MCKHCTSEAGLVHWSVSEGAVIVVGNSSDDALSKEKAAELSSRRHSMWVKWHDVLFR